MNTAARDNSCGEAARLAELQSYDLLNDLGDEELDRIVNVVSRVLDTPIASVALVDAEQLVLRAHVGVNFTGKSRNVSFSEHLVSSNLDRLIVEDARKDPRFAHNPLVAGKPGFRFFAGVPLITPTGHRLGALCAIDTEPRPGGLPEHQLTLLTMLADTVMALLNARRANRERERSRQQVERLAARFQGFAEIAADWLWEQDADFRFTYVSTDITRICGIDPAVLIGRTRWESLAAPASDPKWQQLKAICATRQSFRDYRYSVIIDGRQFHFSVSGIPLYGDDGRFEGYRGVGRDITREANMTAEIAYLATHDSLTGLRNRASFEACCRQIFEDGFQARERIALHWIDIDRFKEVNDRLGHAIGDRLLVGLANRLRKIARSDDIIARFGGDEIVVLQGDVICPEQASAFAERLRETLAEPYQFDDQEVICTVSIGVAICPDDGLSLEEVLGNADLALYRAKEFGRDFVHFFKSEFDVQVRNQRQLEYDLRQAAASNQLVLHYQPQVDLVSNEPVGYEALVRW